MDTQNQQPTTPDAVLEEFSDAELAALKARLKQDPAGAHALMLIQKQGHEFLRNMANKVMANLAAMEKTQKTVDANTDWRQFSGQARNRENAAKERRELAQDLLIGALVNLDNPDWDPLDPSTSKNPADSSILALLNPQFIAPGK